MISTGSSSRPPEPHAKAVQDVHATLQVSGALFTTNAHFPNLPVPTHLEFSWSCPAARTQAFLLRVGSNIDPGTRSAAQVILRGARLSMRALTRLSCEITYGHKIEKGRRRRCSSQEVSYGCLRVRFSSHALCARPPPGRRAARSLDRRRTAAFDDEAISFAAPFFK